MLASSQIACFGVPNGCVPNGCVPNGGVPNGCVPNGGVPNGGVLSLPTVANVKVYSFTPLFDFTPKYFIIDKLSSSDNTLITVFLFKSVLSQINEIGSENVAPHLKLSRHNNTSLCDAVSTTGFQASTNPILSSDKLTFVLITTNYSI